MARASCDERPRPLGVSSWAVREPCRGIRNNGFDDRCYEFRSSDTAHTGQYDRGADIQVGRRLLFAELLARPVTSKFIAWGKGRQRTAFQSNCTSTIAFFAGPSFQEGRVSVVEGASANAGRLAAKRTASEASAASSTRQWMPKEQGWGFMFASLPRFRMNGAETPEGATLSGRPLFVRTI